MPSILTAILLAIGVGLTLYGGHAIIGGFKIIAAVPAEEWTVLLAIAVGLAAIAPLMLTALGLAIHVLFAAHAVQRIASRFEWRDMGYPAVREQVWWTIGFLLAAIVVFVSTNTPRDALYAKAPGDLAVAGRIFGGLFALMALSAFTTPLRLKPRHVRI